MNTFNEVRHWIEAGKQVGKTFTSTRGNKVYMSSVAVQKWNGIYKFYFSEIEDLHIAQHEDYLLEEIIGTVSIDDLQELVNIKTPFQLTDLTPLKGQKIFNPGFD